MRYALRAPLFALLLTMSGCSSLPPEFFSKDRDFSLYGLYSVNPTTGMVGLGVIHYTSKNSPPESKPIATNESLKPMKLDFVCRVASNGTLECADMDTWRLYFEKQKQETEKGSF